MERPRTGPMQFPGELQPGVYLDRATAELVFDGDGERSLLGEVRRALRGIQPVQQARLEEQVAAAVRNLEKALDKALDARYTRATSDRIPLKGHCVDCGMDFDAVEAALSALKLAQEFRRTL